MATMNYSRQREAIKSYLMSTDNHPTADEVYTHVRYDFPKISLATVYRNLNLLVDIGEAIKVTTTNGKEHFDGNVKPHDHVACNCCGKVDDIHLHAEDANQIHHLVQKMYKGKIDASRRLFYGTCEQCLQEQM